MTTDEVERAALAVCNVHRTMNLGLEPLVLPFPRSSVSEVFYRQADAALAAIELAAEDQALIDRIRADYKAESGGGRLWRWFGLSRASWLTLPRVLMHEMPDDWQGLMAALLSQFDERFSWADRQYYVTSKRNGRYAALPAALCNYRHPRPEEIDQFRRSA